MNFTQKRVFQFVLMGRSAFSRAILLAAFSLLLLFPVVGSGQVKRVVIFKCDGLPYDVVDRFVRERDPRTGKSQLPWFDYIFYQQGVRLRNFYVRGMSLSAPSWSLLETGQHLRIKGNVEFDRYTMHTYDYLNFIPYVVNTTVGARVDMPAVEVLDAVGEPLLIDAFAHDERYLTFSLFQRGPRFVTYQRSLENRFKRAPRELFDEWTMGFGFRDAVPDQLVREMLEGLNDPKLQYLDVVLADYDHAAHHNNDRESHLVALKRIDSVLGQVWTAIQKAPLADETALILVSDHGFNSDERIYSQGYNLVKFLGSATGGGHHVITKRRLLLDYSIKSMNPFVSLITTTTPYSFYLKGKSTDYPTATLDFDGNERASIHLRNSDLNLIHILLDQLQTGRLSPAVRRAVTDSLFQTIDSNRAVWQATLDDLNAELIALRRRIEEQRKIWAAQPKKFTKEELEAGMDDKSKRVFAQLDRWISLDWEYTEYVRVATNLLALRKEMFEPAKIKIEDVINKRSMGDRNSVFQLQNYIVGLSDSGLALKSDGSLDLDKSLRRIDYFSELHRIAVRNNVQPGISNRPIDLIALRISSGSLNGLNEPRLLDDVVWVNGGPGKQALILARNDQDKLSFRYLPIKNLTQDAHGQFHFEAMPWQPGLPLHMLEDPQLAIPTDDRESWLQQWHTDVEWLHALHKTDYSNGLIGLFEEIGQHPIIKSSDEPGISTDEQLLRRLFSRQRHLIESDMLVVANNHWNFDVRGFNPGGNHGSFFRISTHSTLMLAGGEKTHLPRARVIDEPYDSLSFVPTVLALTGKLRDDSSPLPALWDKGFRKFPGRVIREVLPETPGIPKIATTGATVAP